MQREQDINPEQDQNEINKIDHSRVDIQLGSNHDLAVHELQSDLSNQQKLNEQLASQQQNCQLQELHDPSQNIKKQNQDEEKCTDNQAFINLFKSFIGIGILALPIAIMHSGWLSAIIIFPIIAFTMYYTTILLCNLAEEKMINPRNIIEFFVLTMGPNYYYVISILVFSLQISVCIGYTIFFINYFQHTFCHFELGYFCESRIPSIIISLIIIIPISLIKNLKSLKDYMLVANIIMIIALLIILYYSFEVIIQTGLKDTKVFDFFKISSMLGIAVFAFEGIGTIFNIRHSMQNPERFKCILLKQVIICLILYSFFGIIGYVAFGNKVADLILFNLPLENPVFFLCIFAYCVVLALTYPLQIFPCVNQLEKEVKKTIIRNSLISNTSKRQDQDNNQLQKNDQVQNEDKYSQYSQISNSDLDELEKKAKLTEKQQNQLFYWSLIIRIGMITIVFTIALLFRQVSVLLNLAGSISGIGLQYIMTIIAYNFGSKFATKKIKILNWILASVGLYAGICGIIDSIKSISDNLKLL